MIIDRVKDKEFLLRCKSSALAYYDKFLDLPSEFSYRNTIKIKSFKSAFTAVGISFEDKDVSDQYSLSEFIDTRVDEDKLELLHEFANYSLMSQMSSLVSIDKKPYNNIDFIELTLKDEDITDESEVTSLFVLDSSDVISLFKTCYDNEEFEVFNFILNIPRHIIYDLCLCTEELFNDFRMSLPNNVSYTGRHSNILVINEIIGIDSFIDKLLFDESLSNVVPSHITVCSALDSFINGKLGSSKGVFKSAMFQVEGNKDIFYIIPSFD